MITRKLRYWFLGAVLLGLALVLGGCSSNAAILTGSSWPGLAVSDGTIFMAYGAQVYAIDPDTNDTIWTFPAEPERTQTFYAVPAVNETMVVVGDYTDTLYALDRENGRELWSFQTTNVRFIGGAAIGEDYVYAGAVDGTFYALDVETGREAWTFSAERGIWSTPLLADGTLYVTSLDRHVYALNADSGSLLWTFPDNGDADGLEMGAIAGTPTLHDGILYFGSFSNHFYALDTNTQSIVWDYPTTNWVWATPVVDVDSGLVIGTDLDGNVFALDIASGDQQWHFDASGPVVGAPAIASLEDGTRVLYVATGAAEGNNLHTLHIEDGTKADTSISVEAEFSTNFLFFRTGSSVRPIPLYAAPLVYDDLLLLAAHQGNYPLYALDRETLLELWTFDPSSSS